MKHPKISVIVPTYNEEENIADCLRSIFAQKYPKNKLEVIVVDDSSTDMTVQMAKKFPVRVISHNNKHGEVGKMIGFKKATGDYAVYIDADIRLRGRGWFGKMLLPLRNGPKIIGSFTRYYSRPSDPAIERYLSFDPLQRDSVYQHFSPSIDNVIVKKLAGYYLCEYSRDKIPPAGLCLYKRRELLEVVGGYKMFLELDFLVLLVAAGHRHFAYVPKAGLYHHHVSGLQELIRKRLYNLNSVYLAREERLYRWFDLTSLRGVMRVFLWVVHANLVIPSMVVGIYKSIRHQDIAGMYEPLINFAITDLIIFSFLTDARIKSVFKNS